MDLFVKEGYFMIGEGEEEGGDGDYYLNPKRLRLAGRVSAILCGVGVGRDGVPRLGM